MKKSLCLLLLLIAGCPTPTPLVDAGPAQARLRIKNGSAGILWIFYQVGAGGGSLPTAHQVKLAAGGHVDYPIPDKGLAATRFWAGSGCDDTGNNCVIGQSGGPVSEGFTCPPQGCAPPVDTKWEGTFGCLPGVTDCQVNPSSPTMAPLPATDSWDTSLVDGFTVPFKVEVIGACPGGPIANKIDCSTLPLSMCPATENLSTGGMFPALGAVNMTVTNPGPMMPAGCYSDCAALTFSQWGGMSFSPGSAEAQVYCCPTPPVSPSTCRMGFVTDTGYTDLVHATCPQVYAYAYDDGTGLFNCPAGVRYEVTFYAPQ